MKFFLNEKISANMLWYNIIINFHCIFIQHFQLHVQINYEKKMKKKTQPQKHSMITDKTINSMHLTVV